MSLSDLQMDVQGLILELGDVLKKHVNYLTVEQLEDLEDARDKLIAVEESL